MAGRGTGGQNSRIFVSLDALASRPRLKLPAVSAPKDRSPCTHRRGAPLRMLPAPPVLWGTETPGFRALSTPTRRPAPPGRPFSSIPLGHEGSSCTPSMLPTSRGRGARRNSPGGILPHRPVPPIPPSPPPRGHLPEPPAAGAYGFTPRQCISRTALYPLRLPRASGGRLPAQCRPGGSSTVLLTAAAGGRGASGGHLLTR